jgi:DNA-directed RNA polymerase specialized sigma24 family protein
MTPNPLLDNLIARENYAELLQELRPKELAVVALRLDGVPILAADEILGLGRNTANERLRRARHRLQVLFPHIRSRVSDS